MQQYQSPDGNYLSEVNAVLQDTGNVLASDHTNEVLMVVAFLNSSDAVPYRGLQANVILNRRT